MTNSDPSPRGSQPATASAAPGIGTPASHTTPSRSSNQATARIWQAPSRRADRGDRQPARTGPCPASSRSAAIRYDLDGVDLRRDPPALRRPRRRRPGRAGRRDGRQRRAGRPARRGGRPRAVRGGGRPFAAVAGDGVLVTDAEPSFNVYRMGSPTTTGRPAPDARGHRRPRARAARARATSSPTSTPRRRPRATGSTCSGPPGQPLAVWGLSLARAERPAGARRRAPAPTGPTPTACAPPSGGSTIPSGSRPSRPRWPPRRW